MMQPDPARFTPPDGPVLNIDDAGGNGLPVIFQHGLCGDARQPAEVFPQDALFRRITVEARGHGGSQPGEPARFSIATFADDLAAFIEARALAPVVVGGISMGAAIALRLAVTRPDLVRGLVLARPAWIIQSAPDNMKPNAEVGALLARMPPDEAHAAFLQGETAISLKRDAPDNLASLEGFFARKPQSVTAALLQAIAADGPGVDEAAVRGLDVPTLVIGHERDSIHPLPHATALASMIARARLVEITPKAKDRGRYIDDFNHALSDFLKEFLS